MRVTRTITGMIKSAASFLSFCIIFLVLSSADTFAEAIADDAKRHFDRGMAAVEMAKTPADYEKAIQEFERAAQLAPQWPDVYYNLGLVQEKAEKYNDAVENLKQYLRLAPDAGDAEAVKSHINKLEYIKEQSEKQDAIIGSFVGTWIGLGGNSRPQFFMFSEEGGQLYLTYETTHIIGTSRERFGWHKVPVARQGRHIKFTTEFKIYNRSSRQYVGDTINSDYNLELKDSDTLKGTAGTKGEYYYFLKARDGERSSLWRMDDASLFRLLFKRE
ncbi:MAG: tetratricopeptide repeat protein [Syntrophaceae bacterium]|nr:tetratricopeptide repeat protein [Syntrophaceae bacterium]